MAKKKSTITPAKTIPAKGEMSLSMLERFTLTTNVLPQSGSIEETAQIWELRGILDPSEEEQEEYGITPNMDGRTGEQDGWAYKPDKIKDTDKDFEFEGDHLTLIQKGFKLLVARNLFPTQDRAFHRLYLKFHPEERSRFPWITPDDEENE